MRVTRALSIYTHKLSSHSGIALDALQSRNLSQRGTLNGLDTQSIYANPLEG